VHPRPIADNGRSASLHWRIRSSKPAVVAILTPIYEAEFLGFSYGFCGAVLMRWAFAIAQGNVVRFHAR
jgi:hypothetical protein